MSRTVTVTLTFPQAAALLGAAVFAEAGEPDGWDPVVLDRAVAKLAAAIEKAS